MKIDIDNIFAGKTVTIVGGGPSLKGFNFAKLRAPIIGVNHSPKFHAADMLVAIDTQFHIREKDFLDSFAGLKVTYNDTPRQDFIKAELEVDYKSLNLDYHILKANLSGYFALALALYLGAKKVYLLGFDGGYTGDNPNFHPYAYKGPGMNYYHPMNECYDFFKNENVVNVGMDSRITTFKKTPIYNNFYDYA